MIPVSELPAVPALLVEGRLIVTDHIR